MPHWINKCVNRHIQISFPRNHKEDNMGVRVEQAKDVDLLKLIDFVRSIGYEFGSIGVPQMYPDPIIGKLSIFTTNEFLPQNKIQKLLNIKERYYLGDLEFCQKNSWIFWYYGSLQRAERFANLLSKEYPAVTITLTCRSYEDWPEQSLDR